MEQYNYNDDKKLGGGIMAVTIILLVFSAFSLITSVAVLLNRDFFVKSYKTMKLTLPSANIFLISAIITVALIISLVLILCKKALGVYAYFTVVIINFISNIVINGFKLSLLANLIFPILLLILILQKKEVFGFAASEK